MESPYHTYQRPQLELMRRLGSFSGISVTTPVPSLDSVVIARRAPPPGNLKTFAGQEFHVILVGEGHFSEDAENIKSEGVPLPEYLAEIEYYLTGLGPEFEVLQYLHDD